MITALFGKGQKELKILYVLITLTLAAILLYPLGCVLFQSILTQDGGLGFSNYSSPSQAFLLPLLPLWLFSVPTVFTSRGFVPV